MAAKDGWKKMSYHCAGVSVEALKNKVGLLEEGHFNSDEPAENRSHLRQSPAFTRLIVSDNGSRVDM